MCSTKVSYVEAQAVFTVPVEASDKAKETEEALNSQGERKSSVVLCEPSAAGPQQRDLEIDTSYASDIEKGEDKSKPLQSTRSQLLERKCTNPIPEEKTPPFWPVSTPPEEAYSIASRRRWSKPQQEST